MCLKSLNYVALELITIATNNRIQSNIFNTDTKGTEQSVCIERCPYKRGHYDDVTFMTPLTVLSI